MDQSNPFNQYHKDFENHLEEKGRATATILAYTKDVEQLLEFVTNKDKTKLEEISTQDIDSFKEELNKQDYTAKSISRKVNSIKSFFRFLNSKDILDKNPASDVSHPKYELKPPRILSKLEYRALRDACRDDKRLSAIIELLLQAGIRIGELASLKLDDLNLKNNKITIRAYESHEGRTVPLTQPAKEAIREYLEVRPKSDDQHVFLTKTGNQFLVRNIRSSIDRYFRIAGIEDAKVNDLRHTFIAQQLKSGTPLVYVSKIVGHKRLSTTERYLKYIDIDQDEQDKPQLKEL